MKKVVFSTSEAGAVQGGAMETETIQKNGAIPKGRMSRGNFKILALAALFVAGLFAVKSCKKEDSPSNVPKNVIDLVNEPDEFIEKAEFELKAEKVGSTRTWDDPSDDDPRLRKSSIDDCHAFNTEWNCDTIRYTASLNPDNFCMFNPLASVLWPGNLVQGNSIETGVPTSIPVTKRQPGNITLAIVSSDGEGAENMYYRTVDKMQFSYVNQAMNEILSGFGGHGYAQYNFGMESIESSSDLNFKLDLGFTGGTVKTSATFGANFSDKKTRILIKLQQAYFTMVYDDPAGLDGVFTPDITVKDLENYTGNGNPICYISSVTYGRLYYLLYESTVSKDSLNAALRFSYKGITTSASGDAEVNFKKTMEKTSVRILQIGGDAEGGLSTAMALDLEAIQAFLEKGANFSTKSPGAPISYTIKYLKNAKLVRMNNTMDYKVEECKSELTENKCPALPTLTTDAVTPSNSTTATLGGIIITEGYPAYHERGVCYSTTSNPIPTIDNNKTPISGSGEGSFSVSVSGLNPSTTYFVRAYAINSNTDDTDDTVVYGELVNFTTPAPDAILPVLTTNAVTDFTATKATLGGNITNTGTPAYTERGVVYRTTANPTTANNKTVISGTGTGNFTTNITGLTPNTTYYVRSYAITPNDTYYGTQVSFTTPNPTFKIKINDNSVKVQVDNRISYCYHDLLIEIGKINVAGNSEILARNPADGSYKEYAKTEKTKNSSATAYYTINYDPGNIMIPRDNKLYIRFWVRNRTERFSDNGIYSYDYVKGTGEYDKTINFEYVSGSWRAIDDQGVVSATYFSSALLTSHKFNHFTITNSFTYSVEIVE